MEDFDEQYNRHVMGCKWRGERPLTEEEFYEFLTTNEFDEAYTVGDIKDIMGLIQVDAIIEKSAFPRGRW